MLHHGHVGYRIGSIKQCGRRGAAGNDDVLHVRARRQSGEHGRDIQPAVLERIGKFVKHDEIGFRIDQIGAGERPGRLG